MLTVIGSINMDLVTLTNINPSMGETVMGESFLTIPGGKGANQAVAAAKLGADVKMIGKVGDDLFGKEYMEYFQRQNINVEKISVEKGEKTGIASITVYQNDNKIIVVPGANHLITPEVIDSYKEDILQSSWLLLQLEIPLAAVERALEIAKSGNVKVILNPAPYHHIPEHWLEKITYLTPNEYEAEQLLNVYSNEQIANMVREKLVITKGDEGAEFFNEGKIVHIPAMKVEAVDTTGAGDTFNGALAVALSEGNTLEQAVAFAIKAAGISVTKLGAQSGMPTREEISE
ncbi:ribokinase [Cytobacillus horneckiae]|uniref:ribokinase n=1 Tax=Cytobacillus horneckiae TaxID=549687 RepID=UPI0020417AC8|nr:ribokinase [Cytobacillus horneckiae]MCM3177238.1 ribokinase [Cytobacillus horneckiae]